MLLKQHVSTPPYPRLKEDMGVDFRNNNSVLFGNLGLTTQTAGITTRATLFDQVTGQTTSTFFTPVLPNYIIGGDMSASIKRGSSYQTFTNGIVSLTTSSARIVEITLKANAAGGYIQLDGTDNTSNVGYLRILRGLSTFIDGGIVSFITTQSGTAGPTFFLFRNFPGSVRFFDLAPLSGAATYVLQGQTDGPSTQISFNSVGLMVREL